MIRFRNLRLAMRLLAAFAALLVALPALAVSGGNLRVIVQDSEQLAVPGADVSVSSPQLIGGSQARSTDANGEAYFVELAPGLYTIKVTSSLGGVTATDVGVDLGRTTVQTLTVSGGAGVEVKVEGERSVVDTSSTSRQTVLTKEFLNHVPTGQSYQDAVGLTAGVTGQGGNKNMAGGATNENTYMLDGADITDPVTGTFSVNFNFDAIQQIEVLLGGYAPEYGTSVGGVVNLVTESGSNELDYSVGIFYTNGEWSPKMDQRYTADGLSLAPTGFDSNFEMFNVQAKVSGPLIRDKAWFIFSYQGDRSLIAFSGIPQPRDYEGHYILTKLTVQPSSEHRLTAFMQLDPTIVDNTNQGDPYVTAEAQDRQVQGGLISQERWQWFLSPDVNIDTMFTVQKSFIEVNGVPCTHDRTLGYNVCEPDEEEASVDWESPARFGSSGAYDSINAGYYYFDDRITYLPSVAASVVGIKDPLGGAHDFKFGAQTRQVVWDQIQGYSGNIYYVDILETPYDPATLKNYFNVEISGPIKFRTTGSTFSGFAQDSYKPVSNVTLNYGSRIDSFVYRNDLGEPTLSGTLAGPRMFGAWDPFGDQKMKIATGWGRFNGPGTLSVASFTSASQYASKLFVGELFSDGAGQGFLSNSSVVYDVAPFSNPNIRAENLRNPRVDEVLLQVEREVLEDFALVSGMSGKFTRFLYEPDETNIIYDSDGSAIIGSRQGSAYNVYRLRTPLLAKRDYFQWDLGVRKIESRRWALEAYYTYTQSLGSSTNSLSGSFVNDPQTIYNYGPLNTDLSHVVKAYGFWDVPKTDPSTTQLGLVAQYYSGAPEERLYLSDGFSSYSTRLEPRGTYLRFNPWWYVSARVVQKINVRRGDLEVDLTLDNLTNNHAPDGFDFGYIDAQNRLLATSRQDPMTVILGARYEY